MFRLGGERGTIRQRQREGSAGVIERNQGNICLANRREAVCQSLAELLNEETRDCGSILLYLI